jgi:hypothetical protein
MFSAEDHSLKLLRCVIKGFVGVWDVRRNSDGREAYLSWSCILKMGRDIGGRESLCRKSGIPQLHLFIVDYKLLFT